MSALTIRPPIVSQPGEPVWAIAEFYPEQGSWTREEYLALPTNRLAEFDNGVIEVLPLPSKIHQLIVAFFYELLKAFTAGRGRVIFAPYPLAIPTGTFREPDVLYMTPEQDARSSNEYAEAAELVIEVVSEHQPARDYLLKREDYAAAGVPEYWIVDRFKKQILVLVLENGQYAEHGTFGPGETATSRRLPGFAVAVDRMLAQD
jgi:Uma2 family endonuclease